MSLEPESSKSVTTPAGTFDRMAITQPSKARHMGDSTLTADEVRIATTFEDAVGG